MIDLKTASSQEIASYFSREVNNMFFKPDTIAVEQKNSRQMKELDLCWNETPRSKLRGISPRLASLVIGLLRSKLRGIKPSF